MENARKATAAVAAVLQYIKTQEEAIAMQSAMQAGQPQAPLVAQPPIPAVKPWGVSGRPRRSTPARSRVTRPDGADSV